MIFSNLFSSKKSKNKNAAKFYEDIQTLTDKTVSIATQQQEVEDLKYKMLLDNKDETFISLKDFLELMDLKGLTMNDILSKCVHVSDLDTNSSVVEMAAVIEDDHIVLCKNLYKCEKHRNSKPAKLRITTVGVT